MLSQSTALKIKQRHLVLIPHIVSDNTIGKQEAVYWYSSMKFLDDQHFVHYQAVRKLSKVELFLANATILVRCKAPLGCRSVFLRTFVAGSCTSTRGRSSTGTWSRKTSCSSATSPWLKFRTSASRGFVSKEFSSQHLFNCLVSSRIKFSLVKGDSLFSEMGWCIKGCKWYSMKNLSIDRFIELFYEWYLMNSFCDFDDCSFQWNVCMT